MSEAKPRGKATYQDVLDAPEHMVAEILDGELVLSPRPAGPHASVTGNLFTEIGSRFRRGRSPGGWLILIEPEIHLGDHVVVPDLAGWRFERKSHVYTDEKFFTLAPDWVCETLSRWTERYDRKVKLRIYAEHEVGHLWFAHPGHRTVEILRRQGSQWLTLAVHGDDDVVRAEPFEDVEIDLARLWIDLAPPPSRASELLARYAGKTIIAAPEG